jgi:RNA polymerase sigma-70 factor (ECF subfamily)
MANEPETPDRGALSLGATSLARDFFLDRYGYVFRFFRRKGFSETDSQELTQEVFLRVYQKIEKLRSAPAAEAWLRTVMATVWKNRLRHGDAIKRKAREVSLEDERERGNEEVERQPAIGALRPMDPLEGALVEERLAAVRGCLGELAPRMRCCLLLYACQDREYREIADLLHVSIETVKSHIYQARQRIEACVERRGTGSSGRVA